MTVKMRERCITIIAVMVGLTLIAGCGGRKPTPTPSAGPILPTETAIPSAVTLTAHIAMPTATSQEMILAAEIRDWLSKNAIPFDTSEPGSGFDDLMPLSEVIGDARIVALGEATHGTHEFFEMKHRLLEFLVKEMGFNVFAIEASWPEANLVNEYVQTGVGNAAELLAGLHFWTWNTQEVLDMIEWMRTHNEDPGDAPVVSFYGFDMQYADLATSHVVAYVEEVAPDAVEQTRAELVCYTRYLGDANAYARSSAEVRAECRGGLQAVYDRLLARQSSYEAISSPEAFAIALQSARLLLQHEAFTAGDFGVRDEAMAENARWLLNQAGPDAKMVIWAHNGHVQTSIGLMGSYLRESYGDEIVVFGFSFYDGSFNAVDWDSENKTGGGGGLMAHQAGPLAAGSFEEYLHSTGLPRLFLDLRDLPPDSSIGDWLSQPYWLRFIGALYDSEADPTEYAWFGELPEAFDVIIYFEETSPSELLRFRGLAAMPTREPMPEFPGQPLHQGSNVDFEAGVSEWYLTGSAPNDYETGVDEELAYRGNSAFIKARVPDPEGFATLTQSFEVADFVGKRLRMRAHIRTENVDEWAGLWVRVDDRENETLSFDSTQSRQPITGTTDWQQYDVLVRVPEGSVTVFFGLILQGEGQVWVDDFEFQVYDQDS